jgi:hypothetical protein
MLNYNKIFIESEISKLVLKSILENKKVEFKKFGLSKYKDRINKLKNKYHIKKKKFAKNKNFKYEIFWSIVEDEYSKKIQLVQRTQIKKQNNFNIIYSDFANILGFLPSLLTLLIFNKEIKDVFKYEEFFRKLQISGDFDNISLDQKISFIKKINNGKISIVTPLCPDYEHIYIGLGLYKYTFNKLNCGLGLIGKRLAKIIKKIHTVMNEFKIPFEHNAYYGDFEAYSKEICKRVGDKEEIFIEKLNLSSKEMKKRVGEIHNVDLLVKSLSSKKSWLQMCKKNEKKIYKIINEDIFFKKKLLEILESRMDLYKSWYPELNKKEYLSLLVKQGAEYTSMGDLIKKKLKNPVVFGLDHPKMGIFYNINNNIPVLYGKPKYV